MVYQIFSDGIERKLSTTTSKAGATQQQRARNATAASNYFCRFKSGASYANLLIIVTIKLLLFVYDALSFPVYFALQRPDRRAKAARQPRSRQLDANTWLGLGRDRRQELKEFGQKEKRQAHGIARTTSALELESFGSPLGDRSKSENGQRTLSGANNTKEGWRLMGSTVSEIFANGVHEFDSSPCLGYRALVTCPLISLDENGQHVFREQSFRTDFTWYTYGQIGRRVQDLASGLYFNSIYPSARAMFLASTCLEWFCMAHACFQLAVKLVLWPQMNGDLKTLAAILAETQVELLMVSCDQLAKLCRLLELTHAGAEASFLVHLRRIVIIDWQFVVDFDELPFVELGRALNFCSKRGNQRLEVLSIGQIEEAGIENPIELQCSRALTDESSHSLAPLSPTEAPTVRSEPEPELEHGRHELTSTADGDHHSVQAPASRWSMGGEPIERAPASSRDSLSAKFIDGNDRQLETSLLNSHRNRGARRPSDIYLSSNGALLRGAPKRPNSTCAAAAAAAAPSATATAEPKADDLALIVYTHGELGQLKAVLLTHGQLARSCSRLFLDGLIGAGATHCALLSLDCIVELMSELCVFSRGGSIGYSNNLKTLFYDGKQLFERDKSDLEAANPSHLLVRPFILEQLRVSLQNYLQLQLNPLLVFVFKNVVYEYKKYWTARHFDTPLVDRLFCSRLKRLFGRRMEFILCEGTTDCSETRDFFAFMVNLPVIELYGPDEAAVSMISASSSGGGGGSNFRPAAKRNWGRMRTSHSGPERLFDDSRGAISGPGDQAKESSPSIDSCGTDIERENLCKNILTSSSIFVPTSGTRIRLENWEEFRLTDSPYPRGRLLIGGDSVSSGYLEQEGQFEPAPPPSPPSTHAAAAAAAELARRHHHRRLRRHPQPPFFADSNGLAWFRTSDIARAFPDGSFEIISAISSIIKMVDGQFVSLSQIEHILRGNQFVDNVCALCGDDRTFVISLVVPNLRRIALKSPNEANLKMAIGMEPEPDELNDVEFRREVCNDRLLCEFVTDHLKQLLAKSGLSSISNRFLLVPEIWTPESELVTSAFEPKRQAVQKFYANDIQSLVRIHSRKGSRRLSDNRRQRPSQWLR